MEHPDWDTIYIKANRTLDDNNDKGKKSNQKNNFQTKETKLEKKIEEGNLKIKKTPAEMSNKEKNTVSHRSLAINKFINFLSN